AGAAPPRPAGPPASKPPPLGLPDLEQMALTGNPPLAQAASNVEAARGRTLQAGLYPNPTIGYNAEQLGLRGRAAGGEQNGLFIDQTFVTAGKLRLNRARFAQEASQMEWQGAAPPYPRLHRRRRPLLPAASAATAPGRAERAAQGGRRRGDDDGGTGQRRRRQQARPAPGAHRGAAGERRLGERPHPLRLGLAPAGRFRRPAGPLR